jgi:GT2 family glycosyltransferase
LSEVFSGFNRFDLDSAKVVWLSLGWLTFVLSVFGVILSHANPSLELMQPTVTFIVPVARQSPITRSCLASILEQETYTSIEILVVDNGTLDHCESLRISPKIRIIREERRGAAAARNCGLRLATGRYLAFIDQDVVLEKEWLLKALLPFEKPWVGVVQPYTMPVGEGFMGDFRKRFIGLKTHQTFNYLNHARRSWPQINTACLLVRAELLREFDLEFNTEYERCEDTDFGWRLFFAGAHFAVSPARAEVHDDRSFLGYLQRSFWAGFWAARLERRWGLPQHGRWLLKCRNILSVPSFLARLNGLSSVLGDVYEYFSSAPQAKTLPTPKANMRNLHFSSKALSPYVRVVWLADEKIIFDLQAEERFVTAKDFL